MLYCNDFKLCTRNIFKNVSAFLNNLCFILNGSPRMLPPGTSSQSYLLLTLTLVYYCFLCFQLYNMFKPQTVTAMRYTGGLQSNLLAVAVSSKN